MKKLMALGVLLTGALANATVACDSSNKVAMSQGKRAPAATTAESENYGRGVESRGASFDHDVETVDSESFAQKIAAQPSATETQSVSASAPVDKSNLSLTQTIKSRFLEAQAANPKAFTVTDAESLAGLVSAYAEAAQRRDVLGAYGTYRAIAREVARIKADQRKTHLALYDNDTLSGRFLNFGNGIIDVFAQFYGSFLALDPSLAVGAGESLVRNITNLLSF